MSIHMLVKQAADSGVFLYVENGELRYKLTVPSFPEDLKASLKNRKQELIEFLEALRRLESERIPELTRQDYDSNVHPLSFAQQRLWTLDKMQQGGAEYNMPVALRVEGNLSCARAEQAIQGIIERHAVLRTVYKEHEGEACQEVKGDINFRLVHLNISSLSAKEQEHALVECLQEEYTYKFDISKDLLIRGKLIQLSVDNSESVLLINVHHIAFDAWSSAVFVNEFVRIYQALAEQSTPELAGIDVSYIDYARWQRLWLNDAVLKNKFAYWSSTLAGSQFQHSLPQKSGGVVSDQDSTGNTVNYQASAEEHQQLVALASRYATTPFIVIHAIYAYLINQYSGNEECLIGTPVANRQQLKLEPLIGFFVNTLVLRTQTGFDTFSSYIEHVKEVNKGAQQHQDLPFEYLVEHLAGARVNARMPLVQLFLTLETENHETASIPGLRFSPIKNEHQLAKYDLNLRVVVSDKTFSLSWLYRDARFDNSLISSLNRHFINALHYLAEQPDSLLSEINYLSDIEKSRLIPTIKEEDYIVVDEDIPTRFARIASQHPNQIALRFKDQTLSYYALNQHATQLSRKLAQKGVQVGDHVAVAVEHSSNMVIAILAVLKAGGVYVPIDNAYPQERISYILKDAKPRLVIGDQSFDQKLAGELELDYLSVDAGQNPCEIDIEKRLDSDMVNKLSAKEKSKAAYIIYTSGSTGEPKGVVQSHYNVLRLLDATEEDFGFGSDDVWTLFHSISFDFSVWELWGALLYGGTLVIPEREQARDTSQFIELCRSTGVSVLNQTPAAFYNFATTLIDKEKRIESLRYVIFGGEALKEEKLQSWWNFVGDSGPAMINMYGITETTVHVTLKKLSRKKILGSRTHHGSIGKPIRDQLIYLLDKNHNICPPGAIGEIYVAGAGLALAYHERPALTRERFHPNPYANEKMKAFGFTHMYKSGDLARYDENGELHYVGRNDSQVKVRGFRIELGEVEARILADSTVQSVYLDLAEDAGGNSALLAYLVPRQKPDSAEHAKAWLTRLKQGLAGRLPSYMLPSVMKVIDELPLTANGKVDRKKLREVKGLDNALPGDGSSALREAGASENFVRAIWLEVLGKSHIDIDDNFFDIGGNSLLAIQVVNRLQSRLDEIVQLVSLFDAPTIREYAAYLEKHYTRALVKLGLIAASTEEGTDDKIHIDENAVQNLRKLIPHFPLKNKVLKKSNRPVIFILSPPRSGSTLLRSMLAGHSQLFAPPELELLAFENLKQRRQTFSGRNAFWLEGSIRALMELESCDSERASELMATQENKSSTLEFYQYLQEKSAGQTLVDKTPSYSYHPEILARAEEYFEHAYYIHLIRQPGGMINSFEQAHMEQVLLLEQHGYSSRELAELLWVNCNNNIREFLAGIPQSRRHTLHFEQLVAKPEQEMLKLCVALDLPYEAALSQPYQGKQRRMTDGVHAQSRMLGDVKFHQHKRIDASVSQAWKKKINEDSLAPLTRKIAADLDCDQELNRQGKALQQTALPVIEAVSQKKNLPLSFAQQRLWFMCHTEGGDSLFNNLMVLKVKGDFKVDIAEQALRQIIQRHEILRTNYQHTSEEPSQSVQARFDFSIDYIDLSVLNASEREEELERLLILSKTSHFDLSRDLMLKARYIKLAECEGRILINLHHIASDGWSLAILIKEFVALYKAFLLGVTPALPELKIQYGDYALWQRQSVEVKNLSEDLQYWERQLCKAPALHAIPLDFPRPDVKRHVAKNFVHTIPEAKTEELRALAARHKLTMFMFLHAVFALSLSRHSNRSDIVIGTPVANRADTLLEPLIGFFVNTLALRVSTDIQSLNAYFEHVRTVNLEAFKHQSCPFEQVVERLGAQRSSAYSPVFQIVLNMAAKQDKQEEIQGLKFENEEEVAPAKYDLHLIASDDGPVLQLEWLYDRSLFAESHIKRIADDFNHILDALLDDHALQVQDKDLADVLSLAGMQQRTNIEMLSTGHKKEIEETSDIRSILYPTDSKDLSTGAVHFGETTLSLRELDYLSDDLAKKIQAQIQIPSYKNCAIALLFERSVDMLIAIHAVLKVGAAYVPIDPVNPDTRIQDILEDCSPLLLINHAQTASRVSLPTLPLLHYSRPQTLDKKTAFTAAARAPDDSVYIIYTSGSTGKPKGVECSFQNIQYFYQVFAQQLKTLGIAKLESWLWSVSYAFDASIKGLAALAMGARVNIASRSESANVEDLMALITANKIPVYNAPPSMMAYMLEKLTAEDYALNLIVSGDVLSDNFANKLATYCEQYAVSAINAYGPTEASVNATFDLITQGQRASIGRPAVNTSVYIVDRKGKLCPQGAVGEILLAGPGLAKGYLNRPDLNEQSFIRLPEVNTRCYCTGDLGRFREDGKIEFLGRRDTQVKVRGYRIEIAEVVSALKSIPTVQDAWVLADVHKTPGEIALHAYLVSETQHSYEEWTSQLKPLLPEYMLPSRYSYISALPYTLGGKIDVAALKKLQPENLQPEKSQIAQLESHASERNQQAENTHSSHEQVLREIWSELLGPTEITVESDFFRAGGHSLLAMRLLAEIDSRLAVNMGIKDLFSHTSFGAQLEFIENQRQESAAKSDLGSDDVEGSNTTVSVEQKIRQIWINLLGRNDFSNEADFFSVGGHSLIAMKLLMEIEQAFAVKMGIKDLFGHFSIQSQAHFVTSNVAPAKKKQQGIPRRDRSRQALPLSFAQQRLWFLDKMQGASSEFNLVKSFTVKGDFSCDIAERAMRSIIARHEMLRTHFRETRQGVVQTVVDQSNFSIERRELNADTHAARECELKTVIQEFTTKTFDLANDCLIRSMYVRLNDQSDEGQAAVLVLVVHHIVADAWSINNLISEFSWYYKHFAEGATDDLTLLDIQYADFALWQRESYFPEKEQSLRSYWCDKLAALPATHSLPLDFPRPQFKQNKGAIYRQELEPTVAMALVDFARRNDLTVFMALHGFLSLVFAHHSGSSDIVIGTPIANRRQKALEPLIGLFLNMLVLRSQVKDQAIGEYFAQIKALHQDAQEHQDMPFEMLVDILKAPRNTAHGPLFQLMFTMDTDEKRELDLPGLQFESLAENETLCKYDLTIAATVDEKAAESGGAVEWLYDTSLFKQESIVNMAEHLGSLLALIPQIESQGKTHQAVWRTSQLGFLNPRENRCVQQYLQTLEPAGESAVSLSVEFESVASAHSQRLALSIENQDYSYARLSEDVAQLSRHLLDQGVRPGDIVGLHLPRCYALVVSMLAVLKTGAAYLPMDPDYPRDRLDYMAKDTELDLIITCTDENFSFVKHKLLVNADLSHMSVIVGDETTKHEQTAMSQQGRADRTGTLAYVIYTSGSTGKPKGVMISHASVLQFLHGMNKALNNALNPATRLLAITTFAFDISVLEIFGVLLQGGTVVLANEEQTREPKTLARLLDEKEITLFQATPSTWTMLLDSGWQGKKDLVGLVGGEALPVNLAKPLSQTLDSLWNCYGPTEATVWSLVRKVETGEIEQSGKIYLGGALAGYKHLVLGAFNQICSPGSKGELCIGGGALAEGYLNRPDLTRERFIDVNLSGVSERFYRTGDEVTLRDDGLFEFHGRLDDQIKIRGYRIEPGEIQRSIETTGLVEQAIVLEHNAQLVAYLLCENESALIEQLKSRIAQQLPLYMLPTRFVVLNDFPKTPNGKIDKNRLRELEANQEQDVFVPPVLENEIHLAALWRDVLPNAPRNISRNHSFFELGGHSLLVVRLVSAITDQFNVNLTIKEVFQHASLKDMTEVIENKFSNEERDTVVTNDNQCLVRLSESRVQRNIFCLPPGLGSAFAYRELSERLTDLGNFYGLQPPQIYLNEKPETLGECIDFYKNLVKTIQPHGPYHLLGYSLGAAFAYELACQLQREGEHIASLCVIDAPPLFLKDDEVPRSWQEPLQEVITFYVERMNLAFTFDWSLVANSTQEAGVKMIEEHIHKQNLVIEGIDKRYLNQYLNYLCDIERLSKCHQSSASSIDVHLIKTFRNQSERSKFLDWEKVSNGIVNLKLVKGSHADLMNPPYVDDVAKSLKYLILKDVMENIYVV